MDFNKLPKKNLVELLEHLSSTLKGELIIDQSEKRSSHDNPLENLIGTIPFLLTNKELFEKNQDIADFAKKLDIFIPSPDKKKKEDIIGRIILAISEFDGDKIKELNLAISSLKGSAESQIGKSSFFKDWEFVIKNMKI